MNRFYAKEIGQRIVEVRKKEGKNQRDFAKIMNISTATLSYYELGKKDPTTKFLVMLSTLYNIDLHWLLIGETQPTPQPKDLLDSSILHKTIDMSIEAGWIQLLTKQSIYVDEFTETYEFLYGKKHKK